MKTRAPAFICQILKDDGATEYVKNIVQSLIEEEDAEESAAKANEVIPEIEII